MTDTTPGAPVESNSVKDETTDKEYMSREEGIILKIDRLYESCGAISTLPVNSKTNMINEEELYYKEHELLHDKHDGDTDGVSSEHMISLHTQLKDRFHSYESGHMCPCYAVYRVKLKPRTRIGPWPSCQRCGYTFYIGEKYYVYYRLKDAYFEKYRGNTRKLMVDYQKIHPGRQKWVNEDHYISVRFCEECAKLSIVCTSSFNDGDVNTSPGCSPRGIFDVCFDRPR